MTQIDLPSPELLRKLLRYEPETGKLFWLHRPRDMFSSERIYKSWNSRFSGKQAFCTIKKDGYLIGGILSKDERAHRIAWVLFYGKWPTDEIDHINGIRSDNRIFNLRCVSKSLNQRNAKMQKNNTSGYNGVSFHKVSGRWRAWIDLNGKFKHLGLFDNISDAVCARAKAEQGFGFTERNGK